jgi:hypothetical protein
MKRVSAVLVVIAVATAACQTASEQLTEQMIEQQEGVENVDIDADTGQVSIETEDGSLTVGGGEIPAGFPIATPSGGTVQSTISSDSEAVVTLTYDGDRYGELVAFYDDWTEGEGGEWNRTESTYDTADGDTIRQANWFSEGSSIGVVDCSLATDAIDAVCVTLASG